MNKNLLVTLLLAVTVAGLLFTACDGPLEGDVDEVLKKAKGGKSNAQTPSFTIQPLETTTYTQGAAAAALNSSASVSDGGTVTYQWYSNVENTNSGGTSLGAGAQTASYTPSTAAAGTTYYYVVATNTITNNGDGGNKTASRASNTAEIVVEINALTPIISTQPASIVTYMLGDTPVTISVTAQAEGDGKLEYQWYSNTANSINTNDATCTNLGSANGAQTSSYTPSTDNAGILYYFVVVTNTIEDNGDGGNKTASAVSTTAAVIVNSRNDAQVPSIGSHPAPAEYTYSKTATAALLNVVASVTDGGTLSCQWYWNSENNTSTGNLIVGAQNFYYTPEITSAGVRYYYTIITNNNPHVNGTKSVSIPSNTAKVTVNRKALTLASASHTKQYDKTTTVTSNPVPLVLTFSGYESGDTVTAGTVTAVYTNANAGTNTINITGMEFSAGGSAANYTIALPINNRSVSGGGITPRQINNGNIQTAHTLVPFGTTDSTYRTETTFNVSASGIMSGDSITVSTVETLNTYGLSLSNNQNIETASRTITLRYNTTTGVPTTALSLTLKSENPNYNLSGNLSVAIYDGQASERAVPVTANNFQQFNTYVRTSAGLTRYYLLKAAIPSGTLSGWTPIGTSGQPFTGGFDGGNFTFSGLSINSSANDYLGLFGYIRGYGSGKGIIKNIKLENVNITGHYYVGGIAGYSDNGIIENCSSTGGSVSGNQYVGGIAGFSYDSKGRIKTGYVTGTVKGTGGAEHIGGIVGYNNGTVDSYYLSGTVDANGSYTRDVGGIVGSNAGGTVQACYVTKTGKVQTNTPGSNLRVGGIVGHNSAGFDSSYNPISSLVQKCYFVGTVDAITTTNDYLANSTGGIVGKNDCTIQNCYSNGNVSGTDYVGGIVGHNVGTAQNCYADYSCDVTARGEIAGGVAGWNDYGTVQNCAAINNSIKMTSANSARIGRVIGHMTTSTRIYNNYGKITYEPEPMTLLYNNASTNYFPATTGGSTKDGTNFTPDSLMVSRFWSVTANWYTVSPAFAWDFTNVWEGVDSPKLRGVGGQ